MERSLQVRECDQDHQLSQRDKVLENRKVTTGWRTKKGDTWWQGPSQWIGMDCGLSRD